MASERFIETGKSTFYGEYIYDRVVPKDHFFRKLNGMLDWRKYTQKMMRWYKGRAVGTALLELGTLLDLEMYSTASKAKHDLITSLGAASIDYKSEDFLAKMQAIGGIDAAFDAIIGGKFPNRLTLIRDYCTENGLPFGGIKIDLQFKLDQIE